MWGVIVIILLITMKAITISKEYLYYKENAGNSFKIEDYPLFVQQRYFLYEKSLEYGLTFNEFIFLKKTIKKESNWKHTAINVNKNGTKDYGLAQINSIWEKEAEKRNLDFKNNWKDNIEMALIIYTQFGGISNWYSMRYNDNDFE